MSFILIYVTYANRKSAQRICTYLLKRRLIACVNYFPIRSASWWTGKVVECDEVVSILKTRERNWEKVRSEIKRLHPYQVPCIMKLHVKANEEYERWIAQETQGEKLMPAKRKNDRTKEK